MRRNDQWRELEIARHEAAEKQKEKGCEVCGMKPVKTATMEDGTRHVVCPVHGRAWGDFNPWPQEGTDVFKKALDKMHEAKWEKDETLSCENCPAEWKVPEKEFSEWVGKAVVCPMCHSEEINVVSVVDGEKRVQALGTMGFRGGEK